MSEATLEPIESEPAARRRWQRKRVLVPGAIVGVLALAIAGAWFSRERIAGNIVDNQLRANNLPATYTIDRITGQRQVLRNVVIGDPSRPDLTAKLIEVRLKYRFGTPQIGRITLVNPRLYGRLLGSRVSFGSLDRLIYRKSDKEPGLPDLDLAIRDGRALIRTPYGPIAAKADGAGRVSDGFSGILAVTAPGLAIKDCKANGASLFGKVTTSAAKPSFAGPLRLADLSCAGSGLALTRTDADLSLTADNTLSALTGKVHLVSGPARYADYGAKRIDAQLSGNWKKGLLDERHAVSFIGLDTPQADAARLAVEGTLRASNGFTKLELRSDVEGSGLQPGAAVDRALAGLSRTGEGTLIAPLARRFASALSAQARGSSLSGDVTVRRDGALISVLVPQAEVRGGSGERVAALSRIQASFGGVAPLLSGNIATGGAGLPQISGRMERGSGGGALFRLTMQPYSAGTSSLAIPQMSVVQARGGAIGFAGRVVASGPLPGGEARGLSLPVRGRLAPGGALALWPDCVDVTFDRLAYANLTLERRGVRLCPPSGRSILQTGPRGLSFAAGAPSLDVAGALGNTPIRIRSGPVGFAYPGDLAARRLDIALGPAGKASRFAISNLEARLGGKDIAGTFRGADIGLAAVPLDLLDASGNWRYAGGVLSIADGDFRLVDRSADARFEPLVARGGVLTLKDNVISAGAVLRHPATDRVVTEVAIVHNLAQGRGFADLTVPGILFDASLQPDDLSQRAKGVIANASGTVTGTGRIDWTPAGVTSTGDFSSEKLDFAAAFGPVKGASGTVHFDDLIGLTTAPGQKILVASVNPGIEVLDGEFTFQLKGGKMLAVEGGSWPFMGGRLILRSVDMNLGRKELRRYVFDIEGLDAAEFIARFELPNISATGRFDGTIPIVFDENGNGRIEGGKLVSRPPGGNVSYVGDLTYKDLSPIANFAFGALRSLDYNTMTIAMNGSLTGEIVTNVDIDGVRQGKDAKRNIITRALANLPIQFKINVRAPFYQLISSFKSLKDPAAVRDPRDLGLLSDDGTRLIRREVRGEDVKPKVRPEDIIPQQPPVQK